MKNVALIYGGRSPEHEVSLSSARNVGTHLVEAGYHVIYIGISREGEWMLQSDVPYTSPLLVEASDRVFVAPGDGLWIQNRKLEVDVVFPVTHGTEGEDGRLQALLELAHLPYAGSDALSSMLGMHKEMTKDIARRLDIPVTPSQILTDTDIRWIADDEDAGFPRFLSIEAHQFVEDAQRAGMTLAFLQQTLGKDLLVKPEASGSSIGVTALNTPSVDEFLSALDRAYVPGQAILVEQYLPAVMEVECAVLETKEETIVAGPGRIRKKDNLPILTYASKYDTVNTTVTEYPAPLAEGEADAIMIYARRLFHELGCSGYARVDFFVVPDRPAGQRIFFNEINTLPGLTPTSHWPVLVSLQGIGWPEALEEIIMKAVSDHQTRQKACPAF